MTQLMKLILKGVALGGRRVHNRYLPEVLALVCRQQLVLLRADVQGIEVVLP
jgi:hypothetical protein